MPDMNIPDEAVEAALTVGNFQRSDVLEGTIIRDDREWCGYVGNMGTILEDFLEAAAPFIAAQALRDEADKWERTFPLGRMDTLDFPRLMRARADEMEAGK